MTVTRQTIAIPLGAGVDQGDGEKVLDPPYLADLENGRWDKRNEYAKREGAERLPAPDSFTKTTRTSTLFEHDQSALCQVSDDGLAVWNPKSGTWSDSMDAPLPRTVTSDIVLASDEDHTSPSIAYDEATDTICVVTGQRYVSVVQRTSGVRLFGPDRLPPNFDTRVGVLGFGGSFVIYGVDTTDDVIACSFNPTSFSFGSIHSIHTLSGTVESLDAHVAQGQDVAHIAVTRGAQWGVAQVNSDGSLGALKYGTALDTNSVAVHHAPELGLVYVLYTVSALDETLHLALFADDYSGPSGSRNIWTVPEGSWTGDAAVAVDSDGIVHCFASSSAGTYYTKRKTGGGGHGAGGLVRGFRLVSRAERDGAGRVVVGVARPFADASDENNVNPCAYLLSAENVYYKVLGKYGLGRIFLEQTWEAVLPPSGPAVSRTDETYIRSNIRVGDELWVAYSYDTTLSLRAAAIAKLKSVNSPLKVVHGEGVSVLSGGMPASYDGGIALEASCNTIPVVQMGTANAARTFPDEPGTWGPVFDGHSYDWDSLQPNDSSTTNEVSYKYDVAVVLVRTDAHGNIHRSTPGTATVEGLLVPGGSAEDGKYYAITTRIELWHRDPSVFPQEWNVELYVGNWRWTLWENPPGTSNDTVEIAHVSGDTTMRLQGVYNQFTVLEPEYEWKRTDDGVVEVETEERVLYTESGELPSEPVPPFLDMCSTQHRMFGLDAEDRLSVWYTKPFTKGVAPEWNASLTIRCPAEGGDIVALGISGDQLVMFKQSRIYVTPVTGGPDALGSGSFFLSPRQIHSDTGCVNRHSVVPGSWGVLFQADRGIYQLDKSGSIKWIGEPVRDALEGNTIVSSVAAPGDTSALFLLSNGTTLSWNYAVNQWSVWTDTPGVHSTLWNERWSCLQSDGSVHTSTPEEYSIPGQSKTPRMSVTTAWLKLASLQGYQRVRQALLLGDFYSGDLTVEVGYDYEDEWTQTEWWWEEDLEALDRFQLRVNLTRQKCQAVRFRIRERSLTPYTKSLPTTLDSALAKTNDSLNLLPSPGAVVWSGSGTTTPGQADPAGGTDAWLLTDSLGVLGAAGVMTSSYVSGHAIFVSVLIDKDASAPNFAEIRLNFPDGMGIGGRVRLRLDTGETSSAPGYTLTSVRVLDLGSQWMVVLEHPGDPAASSTNITIYPARGFAASFPSDNPAATGSVTVYGPRIADATVDPQGANPTLNIVDRPSVGRGFVLSGLQLEVGVKNGSFKMVTAMNRASPDWLELTGVAKIDLSDTSMTALETPE